MINDKKYIKRAIVFLLLCIFFYLLAFLIVSSKEKYHSPEKTFARVQNDISSILEKINEKTIEISKINFDQEIEVRNYFQQNYRNEFSKSGFEILIYYNDTLTYWSENKFPAPFIYPATKKGFNVEETGNGYYLMKQFHLNNYTFVGVQLIKYNYPFTNDYLPANFSQNIRCGSNVDISLLQKDDFNIFDDNGKFLFSLDFSKPYQISDAIVFIIANLYLFSILSLISALFYFYLAILPKFKNRIWLYLAFLLDVIIVRALIFYFKFPTQLYKTFLFSPKYYAESYLLPSIGDFWINVSILILVLFFISNYYNLQKANSFKKIYKYIVSILLIGSFFAFGVFVESRIENLILNSTIEYRFEYLLMLPAISHFAIMCIALLIGAMFFYSKIVFRNVLKLIDIKSIIIISIVFILVSFLYFFSNGNSREISILIFSLYIFAILILNRFNILKTRLLSDVILIFILSAFATYIINENEVEREKNQRMVHITHLADARDKMAEFNFDAVRDALQTDEKIIEDFKAPYTNKFDSTVTNYIYNEYFKGFWERYQIQVTICKPQKELLIQPENELVNCQSYFANNIEKTMKPVEVEGLYFLRQTIDRMYYLGEIVIKDENKNDLGQIFVEITSNQLWKGQGYPELLTDRKVKNLDILANYSYCYYFNNELIRKVGKFAYDQEYYNAYKEHNLYFTKSADYSHLVYSPDNHTTVILSKKDIQFVELISPFAYLFLLIMAILIFLQTIATSRFYNYFKNVTLRLKVQVWVMVLIIASTILLVSVSVIYIYTLDNNKNHDILNEKMNAIVLNIEARSSQYNSIYKMNINELHNILFELSSNYYTDINIYDTHGFLLASSRPKIFEEKMISDQINTESLYKFIIKKNTTFIQNDKIGKYKFLSGFAPIRDHDNKISAYINLPYFVKQNELSKEISKLLIAFSNGYTLITILTLLIALVITSHITQPLQVLAEQFSRVKVVNPNAKLTWQRDDEIGKLIGEYNRMIDELAFHVDKVAKSEREGAWQLMAKQVAHEIKNPLTPIKLNIQMLMRAWDENAPDKEERLRRFATTLISQIDILTSIASEFSDFAQMPTPNIEKLDLIPIIQQSADLFINTPNKKIEFKTDLESCFINADAHHIQRMFNNLLKNAIQAIPPYKDGLIKIGITKNSNNCEITFSDNGIGIEQEKQKFIFTPEFTTKTTGMGLGLAMVKGIVDSINGKIWFESHPNIGTTFFITIPLAENTE